MSARREETHLRALQRRLAKNERDLAREGSLLTFLAAAIDEFAGFDHLQGVAEKQRDVSLKVRRALRVESNTFRSAINDEVERLALCNVCNPRHPGADDGTDHHAWCFAQDHEVL